MLEIMKIKCLILAVLLLAFGALNIFLYSGCTQSREAEVVKTQVQDSLETKSPEAIAGFFLNLINDNKPSEAKKFCSPSAVDFINDQIKSGVFKDENKWKDIIQIVDVIAKSSNEGDTSVVNYTVGDYHNKIKLLVIDKEWKVVFTDELYGCKIREVDSWELINENNYKNYVGLRLRVKNLLYYLPSTSIDNAVPGYIFAAYDPLAKKISMQKKYDPGYYNQTHNFYYNNSELESWTDTRDNVLFVFETPATFGLSKANIKEEGAKLQEHFYYTFSEKPFIAEGTLYNRVCNGSYVSRHTCNLFLSNAVLSNDSGK